MEIIECKSFTVSLFDKKFSIVRDDDGKFVMPEELKRWIPFGTALKPAYEPIIVAMKPLEGTFAENALKHGVAGINIDAGRIIADDGVPKFVHKSRNAKTCYGDGMSGSERTGEIDTSTGRWPANLILDEESAELLDEQSGELTTNGGYIHNSPKPVTHAKGKEYEREGFFQPNSGGASRFFYCAKVSKEERESGLQGRKKTLGQSNQAKAEIKRGNDLKGNSGLNTVKYVFNDHPTLKPIDLTRYIAKLILPPERDTPRRIIVPFCGTGSEMIGAMNAGWDEAVGIDNDKESLDTAEQRLARWLPSLFVNQELMW